MILRVKKEEAETEAKAANYLVIVGFGQYGHRIEHYIVFIGPPYPMTPVGDASLGRSRLISRSSVVLTRAEPPQFFIEEG